MVYLLNLAVIAAGLYGFWKLTRYFWLKKYYRYQGVKDVDVITAHRLRQAQQRFMLDVREPDEYEEARVEGVPLIPLGQLASRVAELEHVKAHEFFIICRGGVRSAKACLILEEFGFAAPLNVAGGMGDWKKQGLPFLSGK
jgi:adenylyltransferase/sulfurtransferase